MTGKPLLISARSFSHLVELLLYRLGRRAFEGWDLSHNKLFNEHKGKLGESDLRTFIVKRNSDVDGDIVELITWMLEPNPRKRPGAQTLLNHVCFQK